MSRGNVTLRYKSPKKDHADDDPAMPNVAFRRHSAGVRERTGGGR